MTTEEMGPRQIVERLIKEHELHDLPQTYCRTIEGHRHNQEIIEQFLAGLTTPEPREMIAYTDQGCDTSYRDTLVRIAEGVLLRELIAKLDPEWHRIGSRPRESRSRLVNGPSTSFTGCGLDGDEKSAEQEADAS
jgi:hypothetical protein